MGHAERLRRIEARIPVAESPSVRAAAYLDTLPVDVLKALLLAFEGVPVPAELEPIQSHISALDRGEQPAPPAIPVAWKKRVPFAQRMEAMTAGFKAETAAKRQASRDRESEVLDELYAIARESAEREGGV